jgi:hypothetical protein
MELEAPDSSTRDCLGRELPVRQPEEETMRHSLFGALLGASLVIAVAAGRGSSAPAYAPPVDSSSHSTSSELMTHVSATDGQPLTVTVIDPKQRVMAVYHVDRASGEITPKSVRNFTWDLQMIEFNSGNPLPQDIRNGLQR